MLVVFYIEGTVCILCCKVWIIHNSIPHVHIGFITVLYEKVYVEKNTLPTGIIVILLLLDSVSEMVWEICLNAIYILLTLRFCSLGTGLGTIILLKDSPLGPFFFQMVA